MLIKRFFILILCLLWGSTALAADVKWGPATKAVDGLAAIIQSTQAKVQQPVLFPQGVPIGSKVVHYYASDDKNPKGYLFRINVDTTAKCQGAHYCNIGSVSAELRGNPQIYYGTDNKRLTQPMDLDHGIEGFYTPGHAMGDYWPPMIEWRQGNLLYRMTWDLPKDQARDALETMANSAMGTLKP